MIVYVAHASSFDYQSELYTPLKSTNFSKEHTLILPHEDSDALYDSKKLFETKGCDLVLAECSYPSTGLGIELAWANFFDIPIVAIHRYDSQLSSAIKTVTDRVIQYSNLNEVSGEIFGDICK